MPRVKLPILSESQQAELRPELRDVIEYRKSGLSLNHVIGCPLDCTYCVRHLFDNYELKTPRALMSDEAAVAMLTNHRYFQRDVTPIQFFNRATDPMLAAVKPHTFNVLQLLDAQELKNHVLLITRWRISPEDCSIFNSLRNVKLTILVTHSGIDDPQIEPVKSAIAAASLRTAFEHADRYRTILYWRPIVPGLNDSEAHLERARELSASCHAVVFTGLFYRHQIQSYYQSVGLPEPYNDTARRKILPRDLEARVLSYFPGGRTKGGRLFRKTSCAVSYAHGVADYNGHYGIRELCDICPSRQLDICRDAFRRPDAEKVGAMVSDLGGRLVEVNERAIVVEGLPEPPRYLMQHSLGYQVHDHARPHHPSRHGRADIGWSANDLGN